MFDTISPQTNIKSPEAIVEHKAPTDESIKILRDPVEKILPQDMEEVICYCPGINGQLPGKDWMGSNFCIGMHLNGYWKRVDNENIQVSHWFPLPKIYEKLENK